jgi:hypothetical protein
VLVAGLTESFHVNLFEAMRQSITVAQVLLAEWATFTTGSRTGEWPLLLMCSFICCTCGGVGARGGGGGF